MKNLFFFLLFSVFAYFAQSQTLVLDSISQTTICDGSVDLYFSVTPGVYPSSVYFNAGASWTGSSLNAGIYLVPGDTTGIIHVTNMPAGIGYMYIGVSSNPNQGTNISNHINVEVGLYGNMILDAYDEDMNLLISDSIGTCSGTVQLAPSLIVPPSYISVYNSLNLPFNPSLVYAPTSDATFILSMQVPGVNCPALVDTFFLKVYPHIVASITNDSSLCADSLLIQANINSGSGDYYTEWLSFVPPAQLVVNQNQFMIHPTPPYTLYHMQFLVKDILAPADACEVLLQADYNLFAPTVGSLNFVDNTVCEGKNAQLVIGIGGGSLNCNIYSFPSISPSLHAGTNTFVANTSTTYTVTITDALASNCSPFTDTISLIVLPAPPIPTISVNGNTLTCNQTGYTYRWFKNGVLISSATQQSYTTTQIGQYSVEIKDTLGCTSVSAQIVVAIDEPLLTGFSLSPNPCGNMLNFKWENEAIKEIRLAIYDINGKEVGLHHRNNLAEGDIIFIDMTHFVSGLYFLKIEANGRMGIQKIIKE